MPVVPRYNCDSPAPTEPKKPCSSGRWSASFRDVGIHTGMNGVMRKVVRAVGVDNTTSLSKLVLPGSRMYVLRPKGFEVGSMVDSLHTLMGAPSDQLKSTFYGSWIWENKPTLFKGNHRQAVIRVDIDRVLDCESAIRTQVEDSFLSFFGVGSVEELERDIREKLTKIDYKSGSGKALEATAGMLKSITKRKVALLIENVDSPQTTGTSNPDIESFLTTALQLHANNDSIGYILATGQYRSHKLYDSFLKHMRDLTLDMHMADVFVNTHQELLDASEGIDVEQLGPDGLEAYFRQYGGYWWGGVNETDGSPTLSFQLSPTLVSAPSPHPKNTLAWADIVDTIFDFNPLEIYRTSVVDLEGALKGREDVTHWPTAWLQAGILSLGSRIVEFHEFHTEAWIRLGIPNQMAREWVSEKFKEFVAHNCSNTLAEKKSLESVSANFHNDFQAGLESNDEKKILEALNTYTDYMQDVASSASVLNTILCLNILTKHNVTPIASTSPAKESSMHEDLIENYPQTNTTISRHATSEEGESLLVLEKTNPCTRFVVRLTEKGRGTPCAVRWEAYSTDLAIGEWILTQPRPTVK